MLINQQISNVDKNVEEIVVFNLYIIILKMLTQVSVEAILSATYVENYLDCVENVPDDLQKLLSRLRELYVTYRAYLRDVKQQTERLNSNDIENTGRRTKAVSRIQQALIAAQELGDEKLHVARNVLNRIENKTRQLDVDYKHLDYEKKEPPTETKEQQPPINNVTNTATVTASGERQSKRARRTQHDTFTGLDTGINETVATTEDVLRSAVASTVNTAATRKKITTGTGKKKKRKSRGSAQAVQREESPPREEEPTIDPDEPTYCLCEQISYGKMIMCENDLCPIEWFHFSCVTLTTKPKGKWFCPKCRGDRPNIIKPKAEILRELERYYKEKEEKI